MSTEALRGAIRYAGRTWIEDRVYDEQMNILRAQRAEDEARAEELDAMRVRASEHFRRQRDDLAEQLRWALDYIESLQYTGAAFDSIAKARRTLRENSALDLDDRS